MAVSRRLRFEVLRRDNHACRYCGASAPDVKLTVDHVTPVTLGGSDDPSNLVAACQPCNAGKSSTQPDAPLVENVKQDALRWGRAVKLAAEALTKNRAARDEYVAAFDAAWRHWNYGSPEEPRTVPRPSGWEVSLWRFYEVGLPTEELLDAVQIAMVNERINSDGIWKYLCGIAWRKVDAIRESAAEIVAAEEGD